MTKQLVVPSRRVYFTVLACISVSISQGVNNGMMISYIVIDECHCILSWGRSKFREAFLELGVLRITIPDAKMVALTATATTAAIAEIADVLRMRQPACVKVSPDRPSIYLEVKKRPPGSGTNHNVEDSYDYCTKPLLEELKEMEELFPRTIVYMPLNWCGHTHQQALGMLSESTKHVSIHSNQEEQLMSFVAQYHAPQTPQMKTLISATMLQPHSQLRLLLATEAYGMGADCLGVRRVIHVGPPKNLETYAQEIGRCARDGAPGHATLYYNNSDVAVPKQEKSDHRVTIQDADEDPNVCAESNESDNSDVDSNVSISSDESDNSAVNSDVSVSSHESANNDETPINQSAIKKAAKPEKNRMTVAMRKYVKNTTVCRRELLMAYFGFTVIRADADECCDVCSGTVETDYRKSQPDPKADPETVRMLMDYFELENDEEEVKKAHLVPEIHTGLCFSLATKLSSYRQRYSQGEALSKDFPHLTEGYIVNIQNILTFGLT